MSILGELVGSGGTLEEQRQSKERVERVEKAKEDFGFFCRTYLGDYFYTDPAEYQSILYDVANTQALTPGTSKTLKGFVHEKYHKYLKPVEKLAGAMFIEPREHGKTVRWSFAYPLWRLLSGRSRYVLLIGATQQSASENLINLRTELEENEQLLEDFGPLQGEGRWSDSRLELVNNTCVQAKGAGMSMRGTRFRQWRPDLIVLDDILKDDAVDSPTLRGKIHRWLKRVVFNLGKSAFLVWVNTIFHSDDPISRLLNELEAGTLKRWIAVRLSCFRPDGSSLWPENWSLETLQEKRETLGSDVFSTEYENEPLSDEDRIIKPEWIERHRYTPDERPPLSEMRIFAGCDPATGAHDGTAIQGIGVDQKGIIWDLDSWSRACSETETTTQMIIKHQLFHFELIAWEEVSFSKIYANYVRDMAAQRGVYLPIKTVKAGTESKASRIRALSPLIENGIIRFRASGNKDLVEQLTTFPKGRFDDLCDALAYAVGIAKNGPGAPAIASTNRISPLKQLLRGFNK